MKTIKYIVASFAVLTSVGLNAQLAPDQNPNYQNSADKYAGQASELTSTQSTTVQDTYEAYDWREAKAAEKQERQDRQYQLRMARAMSNNRCGYYNNGWNNNGYYNNGYWNNGYNNNGNWNNGYYNNGNWNNGYYNNYPSCNSLLYGAGLGLGLYYLLN
jgi:hypothetical protein